VARPDRRAALEALARLDIDAVCVNVQEALLTGVPLPRGETAPPGLLKAVADWRGKGGPVAYCLVDGVFSRAAAALGFEALLMLLLEGPPGLAGALDRAAAAATRTALAYLDAGAEGLIVADDLAHAGAPFASPTLLRRWVLPRLGEVAAAVRARGVPCVFHSCGQVTHLVGDLARAGFGGLHSLQPSAGVDLAVVRATVGPDVCLMGNVELDDLRTLDTPGRVRAAAARAVVSGGVPPPARPDGGQAIPTRFVLASTSGIIRAQIPVQHALALRTADLKPSRLDRPDGAAG